MTEMFVQLKLGEQRYKSKVSSVNSTREDIIFLSKKDEKSSHSKFLKSGVN